MKSLKVALFIILALVLAACGGEQAADGGDGGGDGVSLGQTLTGTDMLGNEVSISYPDGWAAEDDLSASGAAIFVSDEEMLEMMETGDISSGQAGAIVSVLPEEAVAAMNGGEDEISLETFVTEFSGMMAGEGIEAGEYEEITVDGQTIGRSVGSSPEGDAVILVRVLNETNVVMLNGLTSADESGDFADIFNAIIASVSYTPAETE